jgi:Phage gp6-like head-tail connector protein
VALLDSYATVSELKARLGVTDSNDDVAITSALAAASRDIEGACGRQFNDAGVATARVYYPDSLTTVVVDDFSTTAGLIVALDYSNAGTYSTTITSTNYQLEPLNGVVDGTPGWPYYKIRAIQTWYPLWYTSIGDPRTSIQITAQWGWAAVPDPVMQACLVLAEEIFKLKDAPYGIAGFSNYGAVRVRANPKVYELLQRFIRNPIQVA